MIRDIQAKTLLSAVRHPDTWFGLKYTLNLYRGCQHQCIYCDSRSECYGIENFSDILVKVNAIELLRAELRSKRIIGTIGTGSMNDPYMPLEAGRQLTRQALEVIAAEGFPVHIITKGTLVQRDVAILQDISRTYAAVSFTITCASDELARQVEPGAPLVSQRLEAMARLSAAGILCGVTLMPVLPFLEDDPDNLGEIARLAAGHGARYVIPGLGVTLRDRQRAYFYNQLERRFPGLRERYQRDYGSAYFAPARDTKRLEETLQQACETWGLAMRMPVYTPVDRKKSTQPSLF